MAVAYTVLKGGLSHQIIRVDDDGAPSHILRVLDPAVSEAGLGIPMAQEIENTVRAAGTGVGPRVLEVVDADGERPAIKLEYIDGATLCQDDVREIGTIPRIAEA